MKNYLAKVKNKKGFTLVEIIVVLAILAILIAVAVPSMAGALKDAKDKTSMADARAAYIAYELKSTTSNAVTVNDIREYMGKTDSKIQIAVIKDKTAVTEFYYSDTNLGANKYIKIDMGKKATIETGVFPTVGALN